MTDGHRYGPEDSDDLEHKRPDGSSEESSIDDPDEDSIFLDCTEAITAEVLDYQPTNANIVKSKVSAKKQSEEFNADQVDDMTDVDDDCHEDERCGQCFVRSEVDLTTKGKVLFPCKFYTSFNVEENSCKSELRESMFMDCVDTIEVDESYQDSQLITADIAQNKTAEKKNEECFSNTLDDMTDLEEDCHEDERFGSDEMNENDENGDNSSQSFDKLEPNPTEDSHSTGSIWEVPIKLLQYFWQDFYGTFQKMTCSLSSMCKSSLRQICGSENINETNQACAEKTNPHVTQTYGDDAEGAVKVGASKRKSEMNGAYKYAGSYKYQNKFRGTASLGRKGQGNPKIKINAAKQTHQPNGTKTCLQKMEIKVKLEIKISKYASRKNVFQPRTFSRRLQWNKVAMRDNSMCTEIDQNLNTKIKGCYPKDWYRPDNNLSTKVDEIGYLDLHKNRMLPMNHDLIVLPTQPLPPRDSNTWNDQMRALNRRHHQNGFVCHFLCPCCQYQMIVIGEPSQTYTHGLSVSRYSEPNSSLPTASNVSLLLQGQMPMVNARNSSSIQRPIYEIGHGGNSPFSRCTVELSVYGQLSGASTFSTGYSTDESRTGETTLEQAVSDHVIPEQRGELGIRRDLPSNISDQSRTEMSIRRNDLISTFIFEADIMESLKKTLEQFVHSELPNNQVMRIPNSSCQSAESNLDSSSRAHESVFFRKESSSEFTDIKHSSTPTMETLPCETDLNENGHVVYSETSPGERHFGSNVSTETDEEALKHSAIRGDSCTSCQQDLSCGNAETKEKPISSRRHVPIIVRKDLLLLQEEIIHQSMAASDNNPYCTPEQKPCESFVRRDCLGSSFAQSSNAQLNIFCDTNDKGYEEFNKLSHGNLNLTVLSTFRTYEINIFVTRIACVGIEHGPNPDVDSMSCPRCGSLVHSSQNLGQTLAENFVQYGYAILHYVIPVTVTSNPQDMAAIRVAADLNLESSPQQLNNDPSVMEVVVASEHKRSPTTFEVMRESNARALQVMTSDITSCKSKACKQDAKTDDKSSTVDLPDRESVLERINPSYELKLLESDPTRLEFEHAAIQNRLESESVVQRNQHLPVQEYTACTPALTRNGLSCKLEISEGNIAVRGDSFSASQRNHNLTSPEELYGDSALAGGNPPHNHLASKQPEHVNEHLSTFVQLERVPAVQLSQELGELGNHPVIWQHDCLHASDDFDCYPAECWSEPSTSPEGLEYNPVIEGSDISVLSQELACDRVVRSDQLLPIYEHTSSDFLSGDQAGKEPHLQSNRNIPVPEQLENEKAIQKADPLIAMMMFPQDPAIGKDDSIFASKQTATETSSGEDCPTHTQIPSVDVAIQALQENGYSLQAISKAYNRIQCRPRRGSPTAADILEVMLAMEDEGKEDNMKVKSKNQIMALARGPEATNRDDEITSVTYKKTRKGHDISQDATMICCTTLTFVVFLPCGHLMETCLVCALGLKKCPKCNKIIERIVKPKF